MTVSEFLLALFGLLFALIVAEVALKFADSIDLKSVRPMRVLIRSSSCLQCGMHSRRGSI